MRNLFLLIVLLLLGISNYAQPFYFNIEEAEAEIDGKVLTTSKFETLNSLGVDFECIGVDIKKRTIMLNWVGLKQKGEDYKDKYIKVESLYDKVFNRYIFHFYDKYVTEYYELIIYNNFKNATLKADWDEEREEFTTIIELVRNEHQLKKPKHDFKKGLPRYIKKQLKLQASIETGMV